MAKEKARLSRLRHQHVDADKYVASEWNHILGDLHHSRGLWGHELPAGLDKWMLDSIEGPARMRRRLKSNPTFYEDYPYDPGATPGDPSDIHVRLSSCSHCCLFLSSDP